MEIIKDYLRGLPEVGFHRWQSYLSLFSLKRPNKGLIPVRWAFPLAWIKERLKRLYFARGGLPGLAELPKVFFQRWASILNNGGLSSMTAKGRLRGCKESSRLPGLAELPKVGLIPVRWAFPLAWIKERLKRLYFARGGLPSLAELPKVCFEESSRLRKVCFSLMTAKGGLFLSDWLQRWAYSAGSDPLQPRRYSGLPEVGFSFDGAKILPKVGLIQPYKPLFGQRWASIFGRWAFPCLTAKGGLFLSDWLQRWAYSAGSDPLQPRRYSGLPEVGFSCCLYTL